MEWTRGTATVSDDPARLDLDVVHGYLARSYWAAGIPRALVERSLAHSLCFGLYLPGERGERQAGFARVVTDRATFAYLCDVFVLEEERGRGLARLLVECIHAHPELQGLRRWLLVTRDAHGLYERFGWHVTPEPRQHMEIVVRDAYLRRPE
jgi:GNAT superfamily N-acetyltransferase